ncbi:hypothetical protein Lepil_0131 [Leptonema illini DSM 21528]|uniref:Uncharacterized protein n=1 Tax=Leptonema illini DSM 21528 TaxID=929563 RepID=H2CI67_9LEPT|nr:hypothetical protein Lepil_0131 [Leptonema illini DSM 21528]
MSAYPDWLCSSILQGYHSHGDEQQVDEDIAHGKPGRMGNRRQTPPVPVIWIKNSRAPGSVLYCLFHLPVLQTEVEKWLNCCKNFPDSDVSVYSRQDRSRENGPISMKGPISGLLFTLLQ